MSTVSTKAHVVQAELLITGRWDLWRPLMHPWGEPSAGQGQGLDDRETGASYLWRLGTEILATDQFCRWFRGAVRVKNLGFIQWLPQPGPEPA